MANAVHLSDPRGLELKVTTSYFANTTASYKYLKKNCYLSQAFGICCLGISLLFACSVNFTYASFTN